MGASTYSSLLRFSLTLFIMASPLTARAGDRLIDDVPLPDAAVPASSRDVPAPYSQFAGAWAGRWGDMLDHILIVEAISKSGEARVIYANGDQPEWKLNRGWERRTARITGGHMAVQGLPATYDVMPDGRLSAHFHSAAPGQLEWANNIATMTRIDLAEAERRGRVSDWTPYLSASPVDTPAAFELSKQPCRMASDFGAAKPSEENLDPAPLIALTRWIGGSPLPIFSVLVSRHGKIVYALYTSKIDPDAAHYLMSVTKSFTSALTGAAFGLQLLDGPEQSIAAAIPRKAFPDKSAYKRFSGVTLRNAMAMSALDAQVWPHLKTAAAKTLGEAFYGGPDRLTLALKQNLLPRTGHDFQYTDVTPQVVGGAIEYSAQATLLDFAKTSLFDPMQFKNEEWMHEDSRANDNASYGLRLRPVDMQKFGILYLNQGCWEGRQLLPASWVKVSFAPWIKSNGGLGKPDYGWFWWRQLFANGWVGHVADGWKGQRIAVFPEQDVVVTMTGSIEESDGNEENVFAAVMNDYIIPAVDSPGAGASNVAALERQLGEEVQSVHDGASRFTRIREPRMLPSVKLKERHRPFPH